MAKAGPTLISSVQRALHLLDAVANRDHPATAKALARSTGIALPTTYHLLRTLVSEGYLCRVEGTYVLGERFNTLRLAASTAVPIGARARPILEALRDRAQAAAYLSIYDGGEMYLAEIADGPRAPRAELWVGFAHAGHATALGKAILASLGQDARSEYLSRHPLVDLTPRTLTDLAELTGSLERRERLRIDTEEYALGTACVAVPLDLASATGAVAISGPAGRLNDLAASRDWLCRAARSVSLALAVRA